MTPGSPTSRASSRSGELQPGAEVSLGRHKFRILRPLGQGSFSTVWVAVRLDGGGEVAIKETLCHSQEELQNAENESELLNRVGKRGLRTAGFVACETIHGRSGAMVVRLAMAKVPGDSLGTFLQQQEKQRIGNPSSQFVEACNFTYELLMQLVPTFDAISAVALHRDINTHNILVSTGHSGSIPQFSIIDFGLAIDIHKWQTVLTSVPVAGDCRYWPASAWYIFLHGGPKLMETQSLFMEYKTQLDLHAFGITALQVFIDMLPKQSMRAADAAIPEHIWDLKAAWDQYWQDAYQLWEPLYKAFERKTDLNTLRQSYIAKEAHNIIDEDLGRLRRALCNARDAFACAEPGSKIVAIFSVLAELISQGAKPLGREAAQSSIKLASWRDIAMLLNSTSVAAMRCDSVGNTASTTTSIPGPTPSSTTLPLPIKNKLHGITSTVPFSYVPTPHRAVHGRLAKSPSAVCFPTMVMSGAPTISQRSFMPNLR